MILGEMVDKVINPTVDGKVTRDIYSLAIKSIIGEVQEDHTAQIMIKTVCPKLKDGLTKDDDVREECLDILSEIFKRFGQVILRQQQNALLNKDELMHLIPE